MDSRMNFDSILALIENNFSEFVKIQRGLETYHFNNTIADSVLPEIKTEYLELTKLAIKPEVLAKYQPRIFHIEMWDKNKIET